MFRNLIVLPGGRELFSGAEGAAIMEATLTQAVNSDEELTLGSVCSAMLEVTVFAPDELGLAAGDELTLFRVTQTGARQQVGIFIAEKPVRSGPNTWSVTAYDRVSLLDRDVTDWLGSLAGWPYRLEELAALVCGQCGVTLAQGELPNGEYPVCKFSAQGITGRQIMQWIGQAAGRFCRATADGQMEFAWYTPVELRIGPTGGAVTLTAGEAPGIEGAAVSITGGAVTVISEDLAVLDRGAGNVTLAAVPIPTFMGQLSLADHTVAPVDKVRLQLSAEDVGVVWPDIPEGSTYTVTGNLLLTAGERESLLPIARSLYEQLHAVSYTPCKVTVPAEAALEPGQILSVTDRRGRHHSVYVMSRVRSGQRDTLECTGSRERESSQVVNYQSYKALSGKMLNLYTGMEGMRVENRDAAGRMAQLQVAVDGVSVRVSGAESELEDIRQNGVSKVKMEMGYRFDEEGLTISRSGEQMENLLDNTGMYIRRAGETILQADQFGVTAVDVTVGNFLQVGDHARFEDYGTGRTACFWVGSA